MEYNIRRFLLKVFVMTIPISLPSPVPLLSLPLFLIFLYAILSFPTLMSGSTFKKNKKSFLLIIALYLIILLVSVFNYVPGTRYSMSFFRQFPMVFVMMYLVSDAMIKKMLILREVMVFFLIGFSFVMFQFITGINIEQSEGGRTSIVGFNSNRIAVLADVAILFCIELLQKIRRNGFLRALLILAIIISAYIAVSTGSRGGFVGLMLAMSVYFYFQSLNSKRKVSSFVKGLVVIVIIALFFLSDELLYNRLFGMDLDLEGDRIDIWPQFLSVFYGSPLFGVGVFQSELRTINIFGDIKATHNEFITIMIYSGLTGLITFLFFLYNLFKSSYVFNKRFNSPLYLSLLALIIFNFFKGGGALMSVYIWFIFGIIISASWQIKFDTLRKIIKYKSNNLIRENVTE